MTTTASLIFNPNAGTSDHQRMVREGGQYLEAHGWRVNWRHTKHTGHATELARQAAADGDDVAVAAGGDGTINEVVNGLVGSNTALGIFPVGTANVFAADMHIPIPNPLLWQTLVGAADSLLTGQTRRVDVAKVCFSDGRERYFLLWAGIGIDAAVASAMENEQSHNPSAKSLGMFSWAMTGFFVLKDYRGAKMQIDVDDESINHRMILTTINNSQLYGRFWRLSPEAKLDDGLLDVVAMEGYSVREAMSHLARASLGLLKNMPDVHIYRGRRVRVETKKPMPVQLDGEAVGKTPIEVEIVPRALNIIVPPNAPRNLFSETN